MITVIFSRDRAMQLDLCLRSLFANIEGESEVAVIYKYSNETHKKSYEKLKNIYKNVNFIEENDFKVQLIQVLSNKMYVLFLVDDNIFVNKFNIEEIKNILDSNKNMLGFSLRLGKNTTYCYPLQSDQKIPETTDINENIMKFMWVISEKDFGYPLDISSSIYSLDKIRCLINNLDYKNPNQLEWIMYINLPFARFNYPALASYKQSVAFCNPINRVQNENTNKTGGNPEYSNESLVNKFNEGYRIDYNPFINFIPKSCHQEVDIILIKENDNDISSG